MKNASVVWAWSLVLFWISIIVLESFEGSATNTSRILWPVLHFLLPSMTMAQFEVFHGLIRKTGHFLGYGMLCFLFYRAWWTTLRARNAPTSWGAMFRSWSGRAVVLALLGTLAIAMADEWHQRSEPGRGPSIHDVALDESGGAVVMVAIGAAAMVSRRRREMQGAA